MLISTKTRITTSLVSANSNRFLNFLNISHEAVDWGEMASDNNYLSSAASTKNVGKNIAMVIDHMVKERGARLEDIHIVGHSLGAHTAGYAGMFTRAKIGRMVGRITGLGKLLQHYLFLR